MLEDGKLKIAVGDAPVYLLPGMACRHGLIAGATGTGKTVTVKALAQSFSDVGVPVFVADVKGDVSGMAQAGEPSEKLNAKLAEIGITDFDFHACPVNFWDVYGEGGIPVRTTVTEMGPTLLSRLLELSDAQEGVLNIAFHVADDEGLLLLDMKDLRSMLTHLVENAKEYSATYGNIAQQSVGAIQRALLKLEDQGGDVFFGEPALDMNDWLRVDADGKGYVNILDCTRLAQQPLLYSTFLLWMLSELYENNPELGEVEKPKMVFFFDEAHLLFDDAPKALLTKIEQIVKLIRSKGIGIYFITQNPSDIPDAVLAQLGNRVQHALRAYTPAEQKAIKAAAESFRANPGFDTAEAITELGTGEALVSCLDEDGTPSVVERAKIIACGCSMGAASADARQYIIENSELKTKYATPVDRESAYELLNAKAESAAAAAEQAAKEKASAAEAEAAEKQAAKQREAEEKAAAKAAEKAEREAEKEAERKQKAQEKEAAAKSKRIEKITDAALTTMSRQIGSALVRGILGSLKK